MAFEIVAQFIENDCVCIQVRVPGVGVNGSPHNVESVARVPLTVLTTTKYEIEVLQKDADDKDVFVTVKQQRDTTEEEQKALIADAIGAITVQIAARVIAVPGHLRGALETFAPASRGP